MITCKLIGGTENGREFALCEKNPPSSVRVAVQNQHPNWGVESTPTFSPITELIYFYVGALHCRRDGPPRRDREWALYRFREMTVKKE